jgi:ribonucleotide reductase beta subunit family protein with ferritin-like domain
MSSPLSTQLASALAWAATEHADTAGLADLPREALETAVVRLADALVSRGAEPWQKYAGVDVSSGSLTDHIDFSKLGFYPIAEGDREVFDLYKRQQTALWAAEEVRYQEDQNTYAALSPSRKRIYELIVGFFHAADAMISSQISGFKAETGSIVEEAFLNAQDYIEIVHQEAYSLAALVMGDDALRARVAQRVSSMPCVLAKFNFISKYKSSTLHISHRYLAGAFSEGVFFASLFAIINRFKFENTMTGFCTMNDWIARDEFIHRDFNALMARRKRTFTDAEAHTMALESYEVEREHIRALLAEPFDTAESDAVVEMTTENLDRFAQSLVDQVLGLVGVPFLFGGKKVSLPWMVTLATKVNFYDSLVFNYAQFGVSGSNSVQAAASGAIDSTVAERARTDPDAFEF